LVTQNIQSSIANIQWRGGQQRRVLAKAYGGRKVMSKFHRTPTLKVVEIAFYERDVNLRLPFRFGATTMTKAPQAFVRARIEGSEGKSSWGVAAEMLVPKWFDKNPILSDKENIFQLQTSLALAGEAYLTAPANTAFGLTAGLGDAQATAGSNAGLNSLTSGYGPALIDRAVLDALCRLHNVSFYEALRSNLPGIEPALLASELSGFDMETFLSELRPRDRIHARHTVGLLDPLTAGDQSPGSRIDDGLPETLEEIVAVYGNSYYKVKISGDEATDLDRLQAIASVLDTRPAPYYVTLDGNEQFDDFEPFQALWYNMADRSDLARFRESILFIEQPLNRSVALNHDLCATPLEAAVIIDESDDRLDVFPRARSTGYVGVSSKGCKGLYKSFINLARCALWNREEGAGRYFMSGEDLSCQAGVSVQQDLALSSLLGFDHVERNGHHYVFGMRDVHGGEQQDFLDAHPDLYRRYKGVTCLRIEAGRVAISSLSQPGFARGAEPHWPGMREMTYAA
jgi:hypothetical protein